MLQRIRSYCGIIIYLLLVSYGGLISKQSLCDVYYSVAYTAKVLNASTHFWNLSEGHDHSQEEALAQLNVFQEAQEEDQTDERQATTDIPNQKLKYFNYIEYSDFETLLINKRNFFTAVFKPSHFKATSSPPPRT